MNKKIGERMLEEYIEENLQDSKEKLDKEKRKLHECQELENTIEREIRDIQKNADVDFEIFSPRSKDKTLKGKMNQLYENLELIKESIEKLEKSIQENKKKVENFTVMKHELEELKKQAYVSRETLNKNFR